MANLAAMGLVERATRRGTFVSNRQEQKLVGILVGPSLLDDVSGYSRMIISLLQTELNTAYVSTRVYDSLSSNYASFTHRDTQISYLQRDQQYHSFIGFVQIMTKAVPSRLIPHSCPTSIYEPQSAQNDVVFDYEEAGRSLTRRLYEQGVRRLWILDQSEGSAGGGAEIRAALETARALGMPEPMIDQVPRHHIGSWAERLAHDFVADRWVKIPKASRPQGILTGMDLTAKGAAVALNGLGVRMPEEVHLAVHVADFSTVFYPAPVWQYVFPLRKLCQNLANLLHDRIARRTRVEGGIILQGMLVEACRQLTKPVSEH